MADMHGRHGLIQVGTSPLGRLLKWSYKENSDEVEKTAMGDTSRSYEGGLPDGSLDVEGNWDPDDVGQAALRAAMGGTVTVSIYPTGSTSAGEPVISGEVFINSKDVSSDTGSMISGKFSAKGVMEEGEVS